MANNVSSKFISVRELGELLNISRGSVLTFVQRPDFPKAIRLSSLCGRGDSPRSKILWPRAEVMQFLEHGLLPGKDTAEAEVEAEQELEQEQEQRQIEPDCEAKSDAEN